MSCGHLAEGGQVAVLALHQELGGDVSGGLDLAGLLILLVQLLHSLLSGHHLRGRERHRERQRERSRGWWLVTSVSTMWLVHQKSRLCPRVRGHGHLVQQLFQVLLGLHYLLPVLDLLVLHMFLLQPAHQRFDQASDYKQ